MRITIISQVFLNVFWNFVWVKTATIKSACARRRCNNFEFQSHPIFNRNTLETIINLSLELCEVTSIHAQLACDFVKRIPDQTKQIMKMFKTINTNSIWIPIIPDYYKTIPWKPSSASLLSFVRWLAFIHNWRVTAWKEWQKSLDSFGLAEAHSFSNTDSKWIQKNSEVS